MAMPPLRIVHVICTRSFAGAERAVTISAAAMSERGHQVTVLGGRPERMRSAFADFDVAHREIGGVGAAIRALRAAGRVDVVHAHMTAAEAAVILSGVHRKSSFVVTRHFASARGSTPLGRVVRAAMRHVPHQEIAISGFVAAAIDEPCVIVPFGLADRPAVRGSSTDAVVIQRLEPEKDTTTALRAWASSGLAARGWRLRVAGDGSERAALEQQARELGIDRSVQFLGNVDDVDGLRSSAALQLTTAPAEHFGLSVLEAMAAALPVVAADGGAHREVLAEHALYFSPGDHERCADALRRLVDDPAGRRSLGAAAQRRQRVEFTLARHGELLEAVYRRARAGTG